MKWSKLLLTILFSHLFYQSQAQRIQFANNSPDHLLTAIDIYVDGNIFYDNLIFMNASNFMDILPGAHNFSIAPENSLSVNDAFYSVSHTVFQQDTIVAVTTGTNTSTGYNPHRPFALDFFAAGREMAHDPNTVELLFTNGITDAGKIDFRTGTGTWINDLDLGDIVGYNQYNINAQNKFRITNVTGSRRYGTYDFTPPVQWTGEAGIVLTTGFINPASNNNGPGHAVMVVFASGGPFQPLMPVDPEPYARIQLIHSSTDTLGDTVDVYVNNTRVLNDMPYLTASSFIDVPSDLPLDIGIARKNSSNVADTFYNLNITLDSAGKYILATYGIESATGFIPTPSFTLKVYPQALEETQSSGKADVLFMHAATDKPGYKIDQGSNSWQPVIYDGDFTANYFSPNAANYVITLKDATDPNDTIRYSADLLSPLYGNRAITIIGCGFKNPANNSNGKPFGLYAAIPEGGPLFPLAVVPPEPGNVDDVNTTNINIYPNPARQQLHISGIENARNCKIAIYTTTGTVARTISTDGGNTISVSDLAKGIYMLQISSNETILKQTTLAIE